MTSLRKAVYMPGSASASSESHHASRSKRRFTVAEANRTLPLVSRIVGDIVKAHDQAVGIQTKIAQLPAPDHGSLQKQLDSIVERMEDYVDELTEVGCELKDYSTGLVDFAGRHEGRDVCLCWKQGEPSIEHWHELDSGFAGRQPIKSLHEE